jgi:hypothetical protein
MKIWYDTEFIDTGKEIELLSIGMIREDGKTYYAVVQDLNLMHEAWFTVSGGDYWLRKNVMNSLPVEYSSDDTIWPINWNMNHPDIDAVKPREVIAKELKKFCLEKGTPEFWAWYAAYDHVALSQIFGRMLDLPEGMPMWTNDLRQELHRLGNPRYPVQTGGNHNALEDSKWNKILGEYLSALDGPVKRSVGW